MSTHTPEDSVRRARPDDLPALAAMVARCSAASIYRRFHGGAPGPVRREVERIANPTAAHRSWVALSADGSVRGTATLAWDAPGSGHLGILVEDAWWRQGVGRALAAAVATEAVAADLATVTASVQADNVRALAFLRAVAPGSRPRHRGGNEMEVTLPVPARSVGASPRRPATGVAA